MQNGLFSFPTAVGTGITGEASLGLELSGFSSGFETCVSDGFVSSIISFKGDPNDSASKLSQLFPDFIFWKHFGVFDSGLYKSIYKIRLVHAKQMF